VGRLAFTPEELDGGNITQDTVRIDVLKGMNAEFVFWYLQCQVAEQYFKDNQKGVAVRGINVGDVRPMELPLPGRPEQDEIVRRIEAAFARIDRLTAEATRAAHLLDRLDERLLAKAFRGELVPQDPGDEPAEALLARIRAARAAAPRPRRGRRPRSAVI
jgi:type I restriction enzyme S subunit